MAGTTTALRQLADRWALLDDEIKQLDRQLRELVVATAPALCALHGVGPEVAAQMLITAGDNHDRLTGEGAFARLCGVAPQPASSGQTTGRHRLSRSGDRDANSALYLVVITRMRRHAATRAYVERRTAEGRSKREIIRCLKRYVAREVFTAITNPPADLPTGSELREMRTERHLSLTAVSSQFGTTPINISRIERGLTHDTRLARRIRDWLHEAA